ncbi:MAG TPA: MarR family transcriptional regulator [Longimicrobiales bacterium]|nr:MarR family transcriptional regulator [Longimicrobiales bacterium]
MTHETRSVAEEIGQRKPFASPVQELMVTLLRTTDELRRTLGSLLEPEGITLQQYNVLRILRGAGEGGLPTLEIGRRMVERQPGVTRLVDRLLVKGLVERTRGREDRRRVVCAILPQGLALLRRVDQTMEEMDLAVLRDVGAEDLARMVPLLDRLRAAVRGLGDG